MKYKLIFLVFLIGLVLLLCKERFFSNEACYEGNVKPVFSPYDSEEIFNLIRNAKNEIKLELYEFSYKPLADALINARNRNVSIKVILEPSVYNNNIMFSYLLNNGIDVSWATKFRITHSKFMIVDNSVVLVGSINWSENSMKNNREAAVIIYSIDISKKFEEIFDMDFV
jgi:phosphatidylserine/phosphatidylglycerophosphate/cardiolipin synthase-like enzyme